MNTKVMSKHFIVTKYKPEIFGSLSNKSVVFYVDTIHQMESLKDHCRKHEIHLHCVYLKTKKNLSAINFSEQMEGFPLALESPGLGKLGNFLKMGEAIRRLNIRFYFSTDHPDCYKDIRILASLGYPCTLIISGKSADWEALTELMTYSLFNAVDHAEIYPFEYSAYYYDPQNQTDYSAVYFRDPSRYVHLVSEGKLAFFPENRSSEEIFGLKEFDSYEDNPAYEKIRYRWQEFFLQPTPCACCKGWRICLGKYRESIKTNPGCSDFFGEFLDMLDARKENNTITKPRENIWQP